MGNIIDKPKNNIPSNTCASLFLNEEFADIHFAIDSNGEKLLIPAHKILLAKGSPVFKAMFYGGFNEENSVSITETNHGEFTEFLQFFYLSEPTLTFDNVPKVMELLDRYLMSECLEMCETFLLHHIFTDSIKENLSKIEDWNTICFVHQLAFIYNLELLKCICLSITQTSPSDIFSTESFRQCSHNFLKYLLDIDSLAYDPMQMFDACINWAKYQCDDSKLESSEVENLRNKLGDCLHHIQFGLMTNKQLLQCIARHKGLLNYDELDEIVSIMSDNSIESTIFKKKPMKAWNDNEVLQQINSPPKIVKSLNQAEVLSFRPNQILLLGAIGIPKLSFKHPYGPLRGIMTIISRMSNGDDESASLHETNVLLEQFITLSDCEDVKHYIQLSRPITCHPNVLYDIQIIFYGSNWESKPLMYYGQSYFEMRYDHGITVGVERISAVCHLYFNLLFEPSGIVFEKARLYSSLISSNIVKK